MNKSLLLSLALCVLLSVFMLPVSAESLVEGDVNFQKSEQFNYGYNILKADGETIWTVWNTENYCKIIREDETNRDSLEWFQKAVNTALSAEEKYNLEVKKSNVWWHLETMLKGFLGKKYKGETLEMRLEDVEYHFYHL